jgi:3-methylfumaryl-CoA hydratase
MLVAKSFGSLSDGSVKLAGLNIEHLQSWIGRTEQLDDEVAATPMAALAATLDIDPPGDILPPLWHWLYFLPIHRQSELGPDGHARRGGFLPPVELPRRMWAGGRLEFHRPLHKGEKIVRRSRIADVRFKQGRSGALVFVVVRHEISNDGGVAITEEHDIVYRDHGGAVVEPQAAPKDATWQRTIRPDDVLLFRYSALTFNGHRIHYDRRYATETEGYPGLVVHGPLIATLLADLVRRNVPDRRITWFEFRAVGPLYDTGHFSVCGTTEENNKVRLWAAGPKGELAMTATVLMAVA